MDSSTTRRNMESILSKTIQLNNAGVVCLVENNNIEKAVKLFAMAFSNHEKLKLQANRMIITSSSSRTTATAFNESSSPSPTQQQQQQQRSRSTKKQPQHQQLNDLFVRYRHRSLSSSSSSEDDNDVVFRDLIRLPSIEDIISMMKCTNNNNSNSNAHNNNNKNTEEIEEHEYSQIIGFLSTCHTYNLALAHHLCGLELLRSTTSNTSSSSSSSNRNYHIFDRAGRLYELTMRLERTRSKLRQQQKQKQNNDDKNDSDDNNNNNDINTWFTPQILLACLNNLAHLHYRTNNHIRSRTCYLQVQITTKKLWDLKRQQRQGEEVGINTSSNDDCDCDDDDDDIGNKYFAVFWTNACRGLSRLIASSSSSRSPPRSNNKQQHYVTKSSAAAAA